MDCNPELVYFTRLSIVYYYNFNLLTYIEPSQFIFRSPMGGNTSLLRPLVTIQDPFSSQSFSGINSASSHGSLTSSFVGNRQRKQSYGRAAVKKIWHTYSGGGGSTSSTTGNSISSSSSNSSAASTRKGKT